jgi:hypothetical protein
LLAVAAGLRAVRHIADGLPADEARLAPKSCVPAGPSMFSGHRT